MRWFKAVVTFISITILGMYGGQKEKGARRFGIPGFAIAMDLKRGWPLLLLIPVLIIGYGENSWLMDKIHIEFLVRVAYALLLSIPFYFYGLKRGLVSSVALVVAFQVQAGSLGHWDLFGDILINDLLRYGTLAALICFNLFCAPSRDA